jgi:hypothetical protein
MGLVANVGYLISPLPFSAIEAKHYRLESPGFLVVLFQSLLVNVDFWQP